MADNIRVEWNSIGSAPLLKDLQAAESGFKKTQAAVRALSLESKTLAQLGKGFALTGEVQRLSKELGLSEKQISTAAQRLQQLVQAGASTQQRFNALNKELGIDARAFLALDKAVAQYNQRISATASATERSQAALKAQADEARRSAQALDSVSQAQQQVGITAAAIAAGGAVVFKDLISGAVQANREFEALKTTLDNVSGGQAAGDAALAFLNKEVDRLSLSLPVAIQNFTQLAAAAKGTAIEGEGVQRVFSAVAQAGRVNNLSLERQEKAYLAITQIVSKGVVQQEELRGQLSEALPGAVQIFARALGVSTAELGKLIQAGKVGIPELLKFAEQLNKETAGGVAAASETIAASFDILSTEINRFQIQLGESLAPLTRGLASSAASVVKSFNGLNPVFQNAILLAGGLTAAYTLLVAAQIANNSLNITQTATETAKAIATTASTNATKALAASQAILATITGQATAAQRSLALSLGASAATAALFVGAIASVALVVDTFQKTSTAANETRESIESVETSVAKLAEVQAQLAQTSEAASTAVADVVKRNVDAIQESIGPFQRFLDGIRQFTGDSTALETAVNNQSIAFGDLVKTIDQDVLSAFDRLKAAPGGLAQASEQELGALAESTNVAIDALERERPVTQEAIKAKEVYLAALRRQKAELEGVASATQAATAATKEEIQAAKEALEQQFDQQSTQIDRTNEDAKLARERALAQEIDALQKQSAEEIAALQKQTQEEINQLQEEQQALLQEQQKQFEEGQQELREQGQERLQQLQDGFNKKQQAQEQAFQEREALIQQKESESFDRRQELIDRELELEQLRDRTNQQALDRLDREEERLNRERELRLADPTDRQDLRDRFRQEDEQARRQERIDQQQAAARQRIEEERLQLQFQQEDRLAARRAELEAPLEAARLAAQEARQQREQEFQALLEQRKQDFETNTLNPLKEQLEQQLEQRKQEFETNVLAPLKETQEARLTALREQAETRIQTLREQNEADIEARRQAAADRERAIARQQQDDEQAREAAFKQQQRDLDKANAEEIRRILQDAGVAAQGIPGVNIGGRRSGGPVEAGKPYWVGEGPGGKPIPGISEIVVPRTQSYVLSAVKVRSLMAETAPRIAPYQGVARSVQTGGNAMLAELRSLNANIKKMKSVQIGSMPTQIHNSMPRDERKMQAALERQQLEMLRNLRNLLE